MTAARNAPSLITYRPPAEVRAAQVLLLLSLGVLQLVAATAVVGRLTSTTPGAQR